jgi:hypothetical protein
MAVPLLSYNGTTNNILLQITVPKRTGRKRKRGSQDPYVDCNGTSSSGVQSQADLPQAICSQGGKDDPARLLRSLKDNVDKYTVEAVGHISQTHRFRGKSKHRQVAFILTNYQDCRIFIIQPARGRSYQNSRKQCSLGTVGDSYPIIIPF